MQIVETTDREQFNNFLVAQRGSLLQSWQWGEFQKKLGRRVWRLILSTNTGKILAAASVVKLPLPRGKSYLYCPRGPVIAPTPHVQKIWQLMLDKLSDLVAVEKPIFFRVDPEVSIFEDGFQLEQLGLRKLSWQVQPKETLIVSLQGEEADVLHRMKPKTRYNIALAAKKGVVVEQFADARKLKVFWDLLAPTARRDGFSPHPYSYYVNLMETLGRQGAAEMFLAWYQFRPVAGAIVGYFGARAFYLHGASADVLRSVMAPYLVQWSAIMAARARGASDYDFHGIASPNEPRHPWVGMTRFKKGFGGSEVAYLGAYDLVYDEMWYRLYRLARWLNRILERHTP